MKKFLLVLLFLGLVSLALGSDPEHPLLPADRSSPRATLNSFMENCTAAYVLLKEQGRGSQNKEIIDEARVLTRRIKRCMDLSEIAEFRQDNAAKEAAVTLKEVLDRIDLPKERHIPDRKAMTNDDETLVGKGTIPNT